MSKQGKIWAAWDTSTGKERVEFIKLLCSLYRPLLKWTMKNVEVNYEEEVPKVD